MQIIQSNTEIEVTQTDENYFVVEENTVNNVIENYQVLNMNLSGGNTNIINQYVAGESIHGHRAVVIIGSKLYHADVTNLNHIGKVIGISLNAGAINEVISVQQIGDVIQNSWGLIQDSYYYFDNVGTITSTKPVNGFIQILGYAKDSNTLVINKSISIGIL